MLLRGDLEGRVVRLAGAGIRSAARCPAPGRGRSFGTCNEATGGEGNNERTGSGTTGPRWRLRGADNRADQAVRRPGRGGPGGPAGPGRHGVRLPGAQRGGEDHVDPDAAGADPAGRRVDADPGIAAARAAFRGAVAGGGRWPRSPGSWTT